MNSQSQQRNTMRPKPTVSSNSQKPTFTRRLEPFPSYFSFILQSDNFLTIASIYPFRPKPTKQTSSIDSQTSVASKKVVFDVLHSPKENKSSTSFSFWTVGMHSGCWFSLPERYGIYIIQLLRNMGAKGSRVTYFDGSYYEGEVNARKKEHGKGRIHYANGDLLEGTFEDGDCTFAIITKKNGDSYEGNMRDHKYHGQGILKTKNYTESGLFRDNRFVHGKITYPDGSSYEGSIEGGAKNGKGIYISKEGTRYEGHLKNDKYDGKGQLKQKNGTIYFGQFKRGDYHGKGLLRRFENGRFALEYEGDFDEGNFHGQGRLKIIEDNDEYEGGFVEGRKHGHGKFCYGNGDVYQGNYNNDMREDENCQIHLAGGSTYIGGIKGNQFSGRGTLTRSNGDYYEGYFLDGKKSGKGILKMGAAIYEGEFKEDMKNGKGKIIFNNQDNEVFEGSFEDDKKHGKGNLQGRSQFLQAVYDHGVKEGPYRKKIGSDYEQTGTYHNDQLHGIVTIKKGQFKAIYRYEDGTKVEELSS